MQRISQKVYETDKGLWNTIKKWFENLVARLKKLFADLDPQSENGRIVREMGDRLDSVRQMWADMVIEAGTITTEATQEQVKNSRKDLEKLDADYLSAVERGDMETAQRMVDEAAKKAGYDYHLYHGTDADFTKFDLRKHGGENGKGEGYGIYLAANREISAPYGKNVIDAYTKFNRLAEGREKTLSYNEVKNLVKRSCEIEAKQMVDDEEYDSISDALKDTWVSNVVYTYGYSNIEQVYNDVTNKLWQENDNDGDLINEMMALSGANYDYKNALKFYENVLTPTTGIDGFHYIWGNKDGSGEQNDIYLAFNSEQVKSADPVTYDEEGNVIPLSQRFNVENEDIRYSRKGINQDGIEVYETSEETMKLTWKEREAKYLDLMKNEYRGRTAKFVRNGHTFYAQFDPKGIRKVIKGDSRSKGNSLKALIKAGADGDIFELVERSKYTHSSKNRKNHTSADYFDYFVKTVQIDGKVFDLIADVEKMYGGDGGYVYTLALTENKTIKASPAHEPPEKVSVKGARNASNDSIAQNTDLSIASSKKYEGDIKSSRKTVDPITSREELAKALSKVAKGEDRAIVESYKANVNLIKGETARLESLRKEIDEIKYKKSITYEGRELSVKEFEQIAYTRAEETGIEAERVKFKEQSLYKKDHDKKS